MGGRGANMGTGRIQQITVNMEGYYATYRKEKDGNVYKYEGSMIGDRVPRTLKQIAQAAEKMGYEYQSYKAKQVKELERKRMEDREETDKFLNYAYVRDKDMVRGSRMARIGNRATRRVR